MRHIYKENAAKWIPHRWRIFHLWNVHLKWTWALPQLRSRTSTMMWEYFRDLIVCYDESFVVLPKSTPKKCLVKHNGCYGLMFVEWQYQIEDCHPGVMVSKRYCRLCWLLMWHGLDSGYYPILPSAWRFCVWGFCQDQAVGVAWSAACPI